MNGSVVRHRSCSFSELPALSAPRARDGSRFLGFAAYRTKATFLWCFKFTSYQLLRLPPHFRPCQVWQIRALLQAGLGLRGRSPEPAGAWAAQLSPGRP